MTPRETALRAIRIGDIFHGVGDKSPSLLLVATSITESTINARTITHQLEFKFDRRTGVGRESKYGVLGTIDSVQPLPREIYETLIDMDRRYHAGDDPKLTAAEKKALLIVYDFYDAHPIEP